MNRTSFAHRKPRSLTWILRWAASFVVVLLGLLLNTPQEIFSATQTISLETGISDLSCAVEPAWRWQRHEYAGSDFIFNYGPLSQILHGGWTASGAADVANLMRWHNLLPAWLTSLGLWWVLRLTNAPLAWRASAYLLWILVWPYFYIKPIGGLVVVFLCGYGLEFSTPRSRLAALTVLAFAAPILALQVFDLGVFTFAALALTYVVALAFTTGLREADAARTRVRLGAGLAAVLIGAAILGSTSLFPNPFQSFLRDSWEIATGYAQTMAVPLRVRHLTLLVLVALGSALLIVVFGLRWRTEIGGDAKRRGQAFGLLAGSVFCLLMTRYGMTRSDADHVKGPVGAFVCLAACMVPCYLRGCLRVGNWPALVVWGPVSLFAIWSYADSLADQLLALRSFENRPAVLNVSHPTIHDAMQTAASLPEKSLYVWPYESIVGVAADKANPAYTLQAYAAHTPRLEERTIAKLAAAPDTAVMYFANTYPLDDVEHLTRTPLIFRHLLENYVISGPRHTDYLILRRDPGRKTQWQETLLAKPEQSFTPGSSAVLRVDFPESIAAETRASDLIVLRLSQTNPPLARLLKPGIVTVTLTLSNGEERKRKVFIPPDGKPHDVLVSACNWEEKPFWSMFHPRKLWRSSTRVTGVQLAWRPMDTLSVRPRTVTLHSISALRRLNADVRETGLAQANEPELYEWCYGDKVSKPSP